MILNKYSEFKYSKLNEINFTERVLNINLKLLKINNTPEIIKEEPKEDKLFEFL